MRRLLVWALALGSMVLVSGCGSQRAGKQPVTSNPVGQAALAAAYVHAYAARFDLGDPPIQIMPLPQVVQVVLNDTSPRGPYRRRHLITHLSVGHLSGGTPSGEILQALDDLEAPIAEIAAALAANQDSPPEQQAALVAQVLATAGFGSDCAEATTSVYLNWWTLETVGSYVITGLQRPLDEVAEVLDPQSWAHCSTYFEKSFVPHTSGGSVILDSNSDATPALFSPQPGSTWSGKLFEHVDLSQQVGMVTVEAWFKNILGINAVRSATSYQFTFNLVDPLKAKVLIGPPVNGGFDRDWGDSVVAEQASGDLRVTGHKVIRFGPALFASNTLAPLLLAGLGQEAKEIVCTCEVPETLTWWEKLLEWLRRMWEDFWS